MASIGALALIRACHKILKVRFDGSNAAGRKSYKIDIGELGITPAIELMKPPNAGNQELAMTTPMAWVLARWRKSTTFAIYAELSPPAGSPIVLWQQPA